MSTKIVLLTSTLLIVLSCKKETSTVNKPREFALPPAYLTQSDSNQKWEMFFQKLPTRYLAYRVKCENNDSINLYADSMDGSYHVGIKRIDSIPFAFGTFFEKTYYEGYQWILISSNSCIQIDLFGPVIFNQSKKYFASINEGLYSEENANGVQIFSIAKNGWVVLDIQDRMEDYGPSKWEWVNDSTLSFTITDFKNISKKRIYAFAGGTWTIRN